MSFQDRSSSIRSSTESVEDLRARKWRRLKTDFVEYSTLHGISDLCRAQQMSLKILWSIVFVAAIGAAFYGCIAIVNSYLKSPVVVSYFVYGNESLKLPDVIVCPLNRFNKTYLKHYNISDDLAQYVELSFPSPMIFPFQHEQFTQFYAKMNKSDQEFGDILTSINKTFTEFIEEASDINCKAVITSHNIYADDGDGRKRLMDCSEFPTFRVSSGKCFRIPGQRQEAAGYGYGTRINLNLPRSIYSPALNQLPFNGVVVKWANSDGAIGQSEKIHSAQGLDTNLAFIPAGVYALMSLKATRYEFINDPPRYECFTNAEEGYSRVNCFDHCVTKFAEDQCGCTPAASVSPKLPLCSTYRYWNCFFQVIYPVIMKLNKQMNFCREKCKPLCSYWQYTPTISYGTFPSPEFRAFVPDPEIWENLHNNIILEIFYEHLEYTTIKHFTSMAPDSFIAQLGGQVSLWVGGSILTVIQVFVFFLQLLCSKFACCRRKTERIKMKTEGQLAGERTVTPIILRKRNGSNENRTRPPAENGHVVCHKGINKLPEILPTQSSNIFETLV